MLFRSFASVERKIIHVDIDPSSISKRVKVDIPIVGDTKDVLQEMIAHVRESQQKPDVQALSAWFKLKDKNKIQMVLTRKGELKTLDFEVVH